MESSKAAWKWREPKMNWARLNNPSRLPVNATEVRAKKVLSDVGGLVARGPWKGSSFEQFGDGSIVIKHNSGATMTLLPSLFPEAKHIG